VLAGPLSDPAAVVEATAEYREEQTPGALVDWLAACCKDTDDRARTAIELLRASYEAWCVATGAPRLSMKAWGTEMGRAYKRGRTAKTRFYRGIRLR
jgi:phage/plasmid-associated DNA primase